MTTKKIFVIDMTVGDLIWVVLFVLVLPVVAYRIGRTVGVEYGESVGDRRYLGLCSRSMEVCMLGNKEACIQHDLRCDTPWTIKNKEAIPTVEE